MNINMITLTNNISKRLFALIAFIFMITLNTLANALPINGLTTGQISDQYSNLFAPTGLTFSIWGIIYLLLAVYTFMQFYDLKQQTMDHKIYDKLSIYYITSSILNGLWILAWHYLLFTASLVIMIGLLLSLIKINFILRNNAQASGFTKTTFSIYLGWITIATIANVTVLLVSLGLSAFNTTAVLLTILILLIGLSIGSYTSYQLNSISYYSVILWAYLGILLKHISLDGFNMKYPYIIYTLTFCLIFITLNLLYIVYKKYIQKNNEPL